MSPQSQGGHEPHLLVFGLYASTRQQSPEVVVLVVAWNLNAGSFETGGHPL